MTRLLGALVVLALLGGAAKAENPDRDSCERWLGTWDALSATCIPKTSAGTAAKAQTEFTVSTVCWNDEYGNDCAPVSDPRAIASMQRNSERLAAVRQKDVSAQLDRIETMLKAICENSYRGFCGIPKDTEQRH
jgi:hypothetical protein